MPSRSKFIDTAYSWQGVPWARIGMYREHGVHCLGLAVGVMRETGGLDAIVQAAIPYVGFARPMEKGAFLRELRKRLIEIPLAEAIPGDLIVYRQDNDESHISIMLKPDRTVLHVTKQRGKVVAERMKQSWIARAAFRIPGLTED